MEYYSAITKNEIISIARKWMKLEIINLRKIIWASKDNHPMFSIICGI
jgi:hypothetical protein